MKKLLVSAVMLLAAMGFAQTLSAEDMVIGMGPAEGCGAPAGLTKKAQALAILACLSQKGVIDAAQNTKVKGLIDSNANVNKDDLVVFVADVKNGSASAPASAVDAVADLKKKGIEITEATPNAVAKVNNPPLTSAAANQTQTPATPRR